MTKPRVFISYKSGQADRVKRVAEALLDAGFSLFIDNPAKMGWTAQEAEKIDISDIQDMDWDSSLFKVLPNVDAVLGCLSEEFSEKNSVWVAEISEAYEKEKLVTCIVDDSKADSFPDRIGRLKVSNLHMRSVWSNDTLNAVEFSYVIRDLKSRAAKTAVDTALASSPRRIMSLIAGVGLIVGALVFIVFAYKGWEMKTWLDSPRNLTEKAKIARANGDDDLATCYALAAWPQAGESPPGRVAMPETFRLLTELRAEDFQGRLFEAQTPHFHISKLRYLPKKNDFLIVVDRREVIYLDTDAQEPMGLLYRAGETSDHEIKDFWLLDNDPLRIAHHDHGGRLFVWEEGQEAPKEHVEYEAGEHLYHVGVTGEGLYTSDDRGLTHYPQNGIPHRMTDDDFGWPNQGTTRDVYRDFDRIALVDRSTGEAEIVTINSAKSPTTFRDKIVAMDSDKRISVFDMTGMQQFSLKEGATFDGMKVAGDAAIYAWKGAKLHVFTDLSEESTSILFDVSISGVSLTAQGGAGVTLADETVTIVGPPDFKDTAMRWHIPDNATTRIGPGDEGFIVPHPSRMEDGLRTYSFNDAPLKAIYDDILAKTPPLCDLGKFVQ